MAREKKEISYCKKCDKQLSEWNKTGLCARCCNKSRTGEKNPNWKGGITAEKIKKRLERKYPCEQCGTPITGTGKTNLCLKCYRQIFHSESIRKKWQDKDSVYRTEEYSKKLSERQIGEKNHNYGKTQSKELNEKHSKLIKSLWKDPNYAKRVFAGLQVKPTKPEIYMNELLLEWLGSGIYDYVGDGKVFISGRNPDFYCRDKRKIIEVFGRYWHRGGDKEAQERINHFKEYNFETLIIWDDELYKQREAVKQKVIAFHNN